MHVLLQSPIQCKSTAIHFVGQNCTEQHTLLIRLLVISACCLVLSSLSQSVSQFITCTCSLRDDCIWSLVCCCFPAWGFVTHCLWASLPAVSLLLCETSLATVLLKVSSSWSPAYTPACDPGSDLHHLPALPPYLTGSSILCRYTASTDLAN
jgi:hypothetical protein